MSKTEHDEEIVDAEVLPAVPDNTVPVLANDDDVMRQLIRPDEAWADVTDGDLTDDGKGRIPYLELNRKLDGGFVDPDTGELTDHVEFVWLAKSKSRAYFPRAYDAKDPEPPTCRSFDGMVPDPASPEVQSEKCAGCPHSKWADNKPPKCKESVEAMVFLPDPMGAGRLARLRFGGIAATPARRYWDSFSTRMPRRPPLAYVSRAVLEPTDTDNGKFLSPRFERISELTRDAAQPLIDERDQRIADWKADIADTVATADASQVTDDGEHAEGTEPF